MILKTASLPPHLIHIIKNKGTELPFSGMYTDWFETGTYLCRQCGLALFRSETKFSAACGWPSFDEALPKHLLCQLDADGKREEILCNRCQAHLGHVFYGEGFTAKNTRHCVNSASLDFVSDLRVEDTEEAIFAAGCFWGVEYYFKKLPGVLKVEVGYTGGKDEYPRYETVCQGYTGHYEAIRVLYDCKKINYETIARYFFEIHDPTQADGQGPDIGQQYLSVAFYYTEEQKQTLTKLAQILEQKSYRLMTKFLPVSIFWPAENYHQNYYEKMGTKPYCHQYTKRF